MDGGDLGRWWQASRRAKQWVAEARRYESPLRAAAYRTPEALKLAPTMLHGTRNSIPFRE